MSSKNLSVKIKESENSTKDKKRQEVNYYDLWRPPSGIRYELSETKIDIDAIVPKVNLKYTTVEYEPGQDLTVPDSAGKPPKYCRERRRGPIVKFLEEIIEFKRSKYQRILIDTFLIHNRKHEETVRKAVRGIHKQMIFNQGPAWYHELSNKQMDSADALKEALMKDYKRETIINTQETLGALGLVYCPNHTKIEYALKKFYLCPTEFLLTIFKLNRPKEPQKVEKYTLNDRIILSAVVHLTMRETLRELHLRIPSPENAIHVDTHVKKKQKKKKKRKRKYPKWNKTMSPYLKPLIPVEQKHIDEIYKNRHKHYPTLRYFDYVDDMYNVYYVDEPVVKRKETKSLVKSKWTRPPKIPVRFIESKMKKRKVFVLKKPSPYVTPCRRVKSIKKEVIPIPEEEPEEETFKDIICCCSPQIFNEDTTFDLKIKIITSDEEMLFNQKLCPYNTNKDIGELTLIEKKELKKGPKCFGRETNETFPIKRIEYSCKCCVCGKPINICPDDLTSRNMRRLRETGEEGLDTIEEVGEEYEIYDVEPEESEEVICKCQSKTSVETDLFANLDDPYFNCTCKSSSDSCTCCICAQIDKEFLLKIKRYNQIHETNHKPCLCSCKCKKSKKPTCCNAEEKPCKYCFCRKVTEEMEEEEKVEEEIKSEVVIEQKKPVPETAVPDEHIKSAMSTHKDKHLSLTIQNEEEEEKCKCETLYIDYLDAHASCMSLFEHYKEKIEQDIKDYIQDIRLNRCLCGSMTSLEDEFEDEELEEDEIKSSSSECPCKNPNHVSPCGCNDPFAGCTCNPNAGCTCNVSSSSEETDDTPEEPCCCTCGPCQCEKFLKQVRKNMAKIQEVEEEETRDEEECGKERVKEERQKSAVEAVLSEEVLNEETEEEESVKIEEVDSRIMILDSFPTDKRKQHALLKRVLADLADDGYPLAKLPQVYRLPHFQVWLDKRSGNYVSMEDREQLYELSKAQWGHIEECVRKVDIPEAPLPTEEMLRLTWGAVNTYKNMISRDKESYNRKLKQAFISQAQEMFPTTFHYTLPTKSFRDAYFSYLPPDENHMFVFRPWAQHECKDSSKRKPCPL